jgi:hypothetical protein
VLEVLLALLALMAAAEEAVLDGTLLELLELRG